jgi:hypothetical protein
LPFFFLFVDGILSGVRVPWVIDRARDETKLAAQRDGMGYKQNNYKKNIYDLGKGWWKKVRKENGGAGVRVHHWPS